MICTACGGKGGRLVKAVDIWGDYCSEWENCRACNGKGGIHNVPMQKMPEDVLERKEITKP